MAGGKIKISIECEHIAPIDHLQREIQVGSLKMGIYANNGSGKTFLSRLFRMFELPQKKYSLNDNGCSPTDSLIRFGYNAGSFKFGITDKEGKTVEDLSLSIQNKKLPSISAPNYLYHVFNQDYVDENIRILNYERDSDIQGYILGKTNIDLKDDEEKLKKIKEDGINLKSQIEASIQAYKAEKIDSIRDIKRLQDYKNFLKLDYIIGTINDEPTTSKTVEECLVDYNKVKAIPEDLPDILLLENKELINLELIEQIITDLGKSYTLSSFSAEFKAKIKNKQAFIEEGVKLVSDNKCPFCGQLLSEDASSLIDSYTKYLDDSESKTIKKFRKYADQLQEYVFMLTRMENIITKIISQYNDYKTKYIPTLENEKLTPATFIAQFIKCIQRLLEATDSKVKSINIPIKIDEDIICNIKENLKELSSLIEINNQKIRIINQKKNSIGEESKAIRRAICKSAYVYLCKTYQKDICKLLKLRKEYQELDSDISKRKEAEKISKKDKVYETIKSVLDYFFSGKYTPKIRNYHSIHD